MGLSVSVIIRLREIPIYLTRYLECYTTTQWAQLLIPLTGNSVKWFALIADCHLYVPVFLDMAASVISILSSSLSSALSLFYLVFV